MAMSGQKQDPISSQTPIFLARERAHLPYVCRTGADMSFITLVERPWVQVSRPKVCASLCRLFSAGNSRLWTEEYLGSLSQGRRLSSNPPSERFRIPEPFNTAKVLKKTRRVAQRPTELDVMQFHGQRGMGTDVLRAALLFSGGHQA